VLDSGTRDQPKRAVRRAVSDGGEDESWELASSVVEERESGGVYEAIVERKAFNCVAV
jgi:hypothetical protein